MEKFSYICDIMRYKMLFLLLFMAVTMTAQNPKREFRGAWIQSVNGQFQGMGRDRMQQVLQDDRARNFHVHFSRIEWSKGGEKRHWTFADTQFGPEYPPLIQLLKERQLSPVIICESAGTQAEDALSMQEYYQSL